MVIVNLVVITGYLFKILGWKGSLSDKSPSASRELIQSSILGINSDRDSAAAWQQETESGGRERGGQDLRGVQLGFPTLSASLHSFSSVHTGCSFQYTLVGILLANL